MDSKQWKKALNIFTKIQKNINKMEFVIPYICKPNKIIKVEIKEKFNNIKPLIVLWFNDDESYNINISEASSYKDMLKELKKIKVYEIKENKKFLKQLIK